MALLNSRREMEVWWAPSLSRMTASRICSALGLHPHPLVDLIEPAGQPLDGLDIRRASWPPIEGDLVDLGGPGR